MVTHGLNSYYPTLTVKKPVAILKIVYLYVNASTSLDLHSETYTVMCAQDHHCSGYTMLTFHSPKIVTNLKVVHVLWIHRPHDVQLYCNYLENSSPTPHKFYILTSTKN